MNDGPHYQQARLEGRLQRLAGGASAPPREYIGRCAWCGLVDHHLIDETCPSCRERVVMIPERPTGSSDGFTEARLTGRGDPADGGDHDG